MALDFSKMKPSKAKSSQENSEETPQSSATVPEDFNKDSENFTKTSGTLKNIERSENDSENSFKDESKNNYVEDSNGRFYDDSEISNSDNDDAEDSLYEIYIDEDSYQPDNSDDSDVFESIDDTTDTDYDDTNYYVPNFMSEDEEYIIPETSEKIFRKNLNNDFEKTSENIYEDSEEPGGYSDEDSSENNSEDSNKSSNGNNNENSTGDFNSASNERSSSVFDELTNQLLYGDEEDIERIPYTENISSYDYSNSKTKKNKESDRESDREINKENNKKNSETFKNNTDNVSYRPFDDEGTLETESERFAKRNTYKSETKEINRIKKQKKNNEKRIFNPKASMEKTLTRSVQIDENGFPVMFSKASKTSKKGSGGSESSENFEKSSSNSSDSSVRDKKKLTKKEINNFSNFYVNERKSKSEKDLASLLKKPYGMKETTREKDARERRIRAALSDETIFQEGNSFNFTARDKEILEFLAIFKYATSRQLSYIKGNAEVTVSRRLSKMMQKGLVKKKTIYGAKPIWFNTKLGMLLSGYDLPHVTDQRISLSLMQHQFVVNHVAANLWGANMNVLDEPDLPQANRINNNGERELGEMLASETEINSNFSREKAFQGSADYKKRLMNKRDSAFDKWKREGLNEGEYPPPFELGNEWMWAVIPPYRPGLDAYHVPDLIVKRPSRKDGSPRSIAVEIELKNKTERSYEKVLKAYHTDILLYDKVIWVCHKLSSARKLEKIAKNLGMYQTGQVKVIPIFTEDGPYTRGDLWSL